MSGGGSAEKSKGRQQSQGTSFVDPNQQQFLDFLRGNAQNAFQNQPDYGSVFNRATQGANATQQLAGGFADPLASLQPTIGALQGFSGANPYAQQLGQFAGQLGGNSSQIEPVIGTLGEDINRQLQRMLGGAGGVNTQSALAGGLGGGRNQVERGLAQEGALQEFGRQAGQLRLSDYQQRQQLQGQALGQAGQLFGQGQGQQLGALGVAGDLQSQGLSQALQNALGGGQLYGAATQLGMSPFSGQLGLYEQLANIFGNPTVLQQQTSRGKTDSFAMSGYGGVTPSGGGG